MPTYRFRLTSGALLDLQCGDRRYDVSVRVIDDTPGASQPAGPAILFYQQRPDPAGYETLRSGQGIETLASHYMARQGHRFGRVETALVGHAGRGDEPAALSAPGAARRSSSPYCRLPRQRPHARASFRVVEAVGE